jgi:para-aminobenzoate synthetase component 1
MQSVSSIQIAPEKFLAVAEQCARYLEADLFLAGASYAGDETSFVGVRPYREMAVTESTQKDDIVRFAFSDTRLTFGFLSYPYGMKLRGIPNERPTRFPFGHLRKYDAVLEYNGSAAMLDVHTDRGELPAAVEKAVSAGIASDDIHPPTQLRCGVTQSLSRRDYIDRVKETLEYIRGGYTYQLNLSIKFTIEEGNLDALSRFVQLFRDYPAPFYAWFRNGQHQIVSTSPERFLRVRDGRVLSQPIKGTLRFEQWNDRLASELTESPKESAELSMIVDLIRNDISLNCRYGSVGVDGHKSVFVVDNLLQMYSNVTGELMDGRTCVDLLLDAFPGGSVTGCPKRKSMEIIAELEPHTRDIYCGSFFVIRDRENMDSSITIRTGYYDTAAGAFHFFAGSGIVVDSDPSREYDETVAKAGKFLRMFGR